MRLTETSYVMRFKSLFRQVLWLYPTQLTMHAWKPHRRENHVKCLLTIGSIHTQGACLGFIWMHNMILHTSVTMQLLITSEISAPRSPIMNLHVCWSQNTILTERQTCLVSRPRGEAVLFPWGANFTAVQFVSAPDVPKPLCFFSRQQPSLLQPAATELTEVFLCHLWHASLKNKEREKKKAFVPHSSSRLLLITPWLW